MNIQTTVKVALVTGVTGFIGRRLAERLIEEGWSLRLLVRDPNKLSPLLQTINNVVVGDLCDADAVKEAVRDVNVIFHCAANVSTWDNWTRYFNTNVLGIENLMNAIAKENPDLLRLVHLSTVDVYGFPESPCDEQSVTTGNGFSYGETKLLGESMLKKYADRMGLSYTIIRPANVIGPESQFIERIGTGLKSGVMLMVDGGKSNAGLIYIDNLVDYLIWAASSSKAHCECYNVRDNYNVDWSVFLSKFRNDIGGKGVILNLPFPIADGVAWVFEVFYKVLHLPMEPILHRLLVRLFGRTCAHSAQKIQRDSHYVDKINFDEAMKISCRWFLAQSVQHDK